MGLYWPRATREGAIAGLATGFVLLAIWGPLNLESHLHLFQAFAACASTYIVTWIVSLMTKAPDMLIQKQVLELSKWEENPQEA